MTPDQHLNDLADRIVDAITHRHVDLLPMLAASPRIGNDGTREHLCWMALIGIADHRWNFYRAIGKGDEETAGSWLKWERDCVRALPPALQSKFLEVSMGGKLDGAYPNPGAQSLEAAAQSVSQGQRLVNLEAVERSCGNDAWGAQIRSVCGELRELRSLRSAVEGYIAQTRAHGRWRDLNHDVKDHVGSLEDILQKSLNQEEESLVARLESMYRHGTGPDVLFDALPELISYLLAEDKDPMSQDAFIARKAFAAKLGVR